MKKTITIIILLATLFSVLFTGCTEENEPLKSNKAPVSQNSAPIAIIKAPETAYYGEKVKFDASESYDADGEIISYDWDFGDGEQSEGRTIDHIYIFENDFHVNFPIIYTVLLYVQDDNNSIKITDYQIKIYPKEYIFYLAPEKLTLEKPEYSVDTLQKSALQKIGIYTFNDNVSIEKCEWNATIFLEKPLLLRATKLSITFYDNNDNEISTKEENIGFNKLWTEKAVKLNGIFDKTENFKSIKITVSGFSIRNKLNIICGGEKASYICFNFIQ